MSEQRTQPEENKLSPYIQKDAFPSVEPVIFGESNLEAWGHFLFPPAKFPGLDAPRSLTIESKKVTVRPLAGSKSYTHRTYMTFLALLFIWYRAPHHDGLVHCTLSDIARVKGQSPKSGKHRANIAEDLDCLSGTAMDWRKSFDTEEAEGSTVYRMHLLHDFFSEEYRLKKPAERFRTKFRMKIDSAILGQIKARRVNPIAFESLLSITSDTSAVYFRYIDNIMSPKTDKKPWEWSAKRAFSTLGFSSTSPRYKHKSYRKKTLDRIAKDIHGTTLSSGEELRCSVHETADGKDFKLRHWKAGRKHAPATKPGLPIVNTDADQVEYLAHEIAAVVGQEDTHLDWYKTLARHYTSNHIFRALGLYKEAVNAPDNGVRDPGAYFTYTMHLLAHELGLEWVGQDCGDFCPLRKENRLL